MQNQALRSCLLAGTNIIRVTNQEIHRRANMEPLSLRRQKIVNKYFQSKWGTDQMVTVCKEILNPYLNENHSWHATVHTALNDVILEQPLP